MVLLIAQVSVSVSPGQTTAAPTTPSITTSTSRYGNPLVEHKHERNCKALCEHCGCLGFYCGEECICECNNENSDTECIQTMQVNARTLKAPFEILIQGPSSNRFVRNARQFEQKRKLVARSGDLDNKSTRNRRSTITIYEPLFQFGSKRPALSLNALDTETLSMKKSEFARHKRSVDHLEWFNDFASTLVRPSPLGTRAQQQRAAAFKRQAVTASPLPRPHREPWFLEQAAPNKLTRPAPLNKRQKQQQHEDNERARKSRKSKVIKPVSIEENTEVEEPKSLPEIRPLRDALQVVERIPRVLQDTVSHLAADNNSGDVFSLNIMNDVLPKSIERKEPKRN